MIRRFIFFFGAFILTGLLPFRSTAAGSEKAASLDDDYLNGDARLLWKGTNFMCGPRCLWQIAHVYGRPESLNHIARLARTDLQRGTTIEGMVAAARQMELEAHVVATNIEALTQDPCVAILLLTAENANHYVILDKIDDGKIRLLDADKFRTLSVKDLESIWHGPAIVIGDIGDHPTSDVERYLGRGLQTSGLLILIVVAMCGVKHMYSYSLRKQVSRDQFAR